MHPRTPVHLSCMQLASYTWIPPLWKTNDQMIAVTHSRPLRNSPLDFILIHLLCGCWGSELTVQPEELRHFNKQLYSKSISFSTLTSIHTTTVGCENKTCHKKSSISGDHSSVLLSYYCWCCVSPTCQSKTAEPRPLLYLYVPADNNE